MLPTADHLATPAGTAHTLRAFGIRPRKRYGQHFLVSRRALNTILAAAALGPDDTVLEVGAGIGTLTVALAQRAGRVLAVEVDPALRPALTAAVSACSNVAVMIADVLELDVPALLRPFHGPKKAVANLPYNIASAVVVSLLERPLGVSTMAFTLQREVADRMAAPPGGKDYGLLSVAVQLRAAVSVVGRVPATAFFPPPGVESAVVRLDVRDRPAVAVGDVAAFFRVVRAAFGQRRKTLRNALAGGLHLHTVEVEAACARATIEPGRRGETLTLAEFAALTDAVRPALRTVLPGSVAGGG